MARLHTERHYIQTIGWQSGSLALLADAAHNLSDVGGLLLAWAAFAAGRLKPNLRHIYGSRGSILSSFAKAIILWSRWAHWPGVPCNVYSRRQRLML